MAVELFDRKIQN